MQLQSVIRAIYPLSCVSCDARVEDAHGLCGECWSGTTFISGLVCNSCGTPLPGQDDGSVAQCDDCLTVARPWSQGRAALAYRDIGRRMVLALKHGDRTDLVPTLAGWMVGAARGLEDAERLVVPVPLHWTRLLRRRYNQAALLAQHFGRQTDQEVCVDALLRPRRTAPLDGHGRDARFAALAGGIRANPKRAVAIRDRKVLLVDDVMTSGATLAASTEALNSMGAKDVSILTLARVVKDT